MSTIEKELPFSFSAAARFTWGYAYRNKLAFWTVGLIQLLRAAGEVLTPYLTGMFANYLTLPGATLAGAFVYLAWIVALGLCYWFLTLCSHLVYDKWVKLPAMRDAAYDTFKHVQRFETDWHVNTFAGSTVTKIRRGSWSIERFLDNFYDGIIPLGLIMLLMIGLLSVTFPFLAGVLAVCGVIYTGSSIYLAIRFILPRSKQQAVMDTLVSGACADAVTCNPTVKSFGREAEEDKRFSDKLSVWRQAIFSNYTTHNTVEFVQSIVMNLLKFGLLGSIIWFWAQGKAQVGDTVFILGTYNLISSHLRGIGNNVRQIQNAVGDLMDMVIFHDTPLGIKDAPKAPKAHLTKGEIRFEKVTFRYPGQETAIYENFDLHIAPGEKVALVGHSGSGKTTLTKLIARLYDTAEGKVLIDGQDIRDVTQSSLRSQIAIVPQDPLLFHRSLADNIAYGRPHATQKEIEAAAKLAHAHEFINGLPLGYRTLVGERGIKLSGGERQRVAIARAILAHTPLILMDEATSSLDSESEKLIQDALKSLLAGKTAIIIAHRLSTIKQVDRILVFDQGKVVEEGNHDTLVKRKDGIYRRLYELQAGGFLTTSPSIPEDDAAWNELIGQIRSRLPGEGGTLA